MTNPHPLDEWKQYLKEDDYEYLYQFVENAKNSLPNYKMIIFVGAGRTGKSRLIEDISEYIGINTQNVRRCDTYGSAFLEPIVKLVHVVAIENYQKRYRQQLKNVIQYGQSVITSTNNIESVNKSILESAKVILMEHQFL